MSPATRRPVVREVVPRWPLRLGVGSPDGVLRRRSGGLERLLHVDGRPVLVHISQPVAARLVFSARAEREDLADEGIARMRFALAADDDLREFWERFRWDPLVGRSVRTRPELRVRRRPEPFEALAWAVTEQLIDFGRAAAIQRRLVRRLGRRCAVTGLRDVPAAAALADAAPAVLEACGLSASRASALRRAAAEVAGGRVDLRAPDHERGWARLRAIPGIGTWTIDLLGLHGQGRYDRLPAGDLHYRRLVGRLADGDPRRLADEQEVREFFAPYGAWAGLAGVHALAGGAAAGVRAPFTAGTSPRSRSPRPAGTRSSRPGRHRRAAR